MIFKPCANCNATTKMTETPRPDTPHEASLSCSVCGRFWGWKAKEQNATARRKNKHTPESLGIESCQLCHRPRHRLGTNETLTVHHVIEVQDGGEDTPENIWVVCSHCHSVIHHHRTYLSAHHSAIYDKFERIKGVIDTIPLRSGSYEAIIRDLIDILEI